MTKHECANTMANCNICAMVMYCFHGHLIFSAAMR